MRKNKSLWKKNIYIFFSNSLGSGWKEGESEQARAQTWLHKLFLPFTFIVTVAAIIPRRCSFSFHPFVNTVFLEKGGVEYDQNMGCLAAIYIVKGQFLFLFF